MEFNSLLFVVLCDVILLSLIHFTTLNHIPIFEFVSVATAAEFVKLAVVGWFLFTKGNHKHFLSIQRTVVVQFAISSALYVTSNFVFHASLTVVPPAIFVASTSSLQVIFTLLFQQHVSGRKMAVCGGLCAGVLLILSIVFSSINAIIGDIFQDVYNDNNMQQLLVLAAICSCLSVSSSLLQEKLLKEAPNLMAANVVNYSFGSVFHALLLLFTWITVPLTSGGIFSGFGVFWVQLMPIFMALSGVAGSFVLQRWDNMVWLLCRGAAVLLAHR